MNYVRTLKWPDNWLDFVDLLKNTVIAATVAIVGGVYWYYERLDEQRAASAAAAREGLSDQRDAIGLFIQVMPADDDPRAAPKLNFLTAYCDDAQLAMGGEASAKFRVTQALCGEVRQLALNRISSQQEAAAQSAGAAAKTGDASTYLATAAASEFTAAAAAAEAGAPASSDAWYAVIASLPLDRPDLVPPLVASLNRKLEEAGLPPNDVKVFETEISRNFALTSGGAKTEAAAKARAAMLRRAGVPDAFPQRDRNWKRSERF